MHICIKYYLKIDEKQIKENEDRNHKKKEKEINFIIKQNDANLMQK